MTGRFPQRRTITVGDDEWLRFLYLQASVSLLGGRVHVWKCQGNAG